MLSHYGLDTRNTTLNIIPIGLNYNEDYSVLKSAVPYDVMHYSVRNNRYVLNKYDDVVDQFIENKVIPDVSIESLQNAESMIKTAFPTLSIKADGIPSIAVPAIVFAADPPATSCTPIVLRFCQIFSPISLSTCCMLPLGK